MLRRSFLQLLASGVLFALLGARARALPGPYFFSHGVARGDPLADAVILWTRIGGGSCDSVGVRWQVARDAAMRSVLASGVAETGADRDYTVKVDAQGLPGGTRLYFQFTVGYVRSPVGRTSTPAAVRVDAAKFAVVSCSIYPYGYFHAYRDIAERDEIDAVIHLGDYIYEYGMGE